MLKISFSPSGMRHCLVCIYQTTWSIEVSIRGARNLISKLLIKLLTVNLPSYMIVDKCLGSRFDRLAEVEG